MEFSPENTSFYFIYQYGINNQVFRKVVDDAYEKLSDRFQKLTGDLGNENHVSPQEPRFIGALIR